MKNLSFIYFFGIILFIGCTSQNKTALTDKNIIGKPAVTMESNRLTPEILWSFGRIGEVALSPDKTTVVFSVKYFDISENKGNSDLYSMKVDGADIKQITHSAKSENNILWRPDGKKIGFLYPDESGMQLWEMNPDGTNRKKITNVKDGINGFKYSPDQSKILYIKEVPTGLEVKDIYSDLPKANAYISDDLMYRHWDTWTKSFSHIFISDYDGETLTNDKDIMASEKFDSPNKPFGGMEQIVWSPDSKSIVYTCVKKSGKDYAITTNSDLIQYKIVEGKSYNITEGMAGYDKNPVFSPNGKWLAWESMEHDGYESDKSRLFILNFETDQKKEYTKNFDQNVQGLLWSDESDKLFFVSDWHARFQIYCLDIVAEKIDVLTNGDHDYEALWYAGDRLLATRMSISSPIEIYTIQLADKTVSQISKVNTDLLSKIKMGKVEERWVKTTDNKDMMVWVIYPPDFDSTKKYPAILYCQGGPQSSVSQFFSYRWNFQIMAANDYIVVAPNRRGLPSFGHDWNRQISGDWPGQNQKDYLSAIDALTKEPYIDENRVGAVGASYGGFSVYWLAGNHNKRFKAFIAHDGSFNLESMYLETEEMWFVNWEFGGPYWENNNPTVEKTYANSPHKFVDKWDTPILIIHGEKDYRISYTQGLQAFTAAKMKGIPARLLVFPEENHWVLSPQNGILWQREFFGWLDKWLK